MKRFFIAVLALALLLAGAVFFLRVKEKQTEPSPLAVPAAVSDSVAPGPAKISSPNVSAKGVKPEFLQFIASEAPGLSSTRTDAEAAERRVKAEAAAMGEPELNYARDLALQNEAPANDRILAVYLLANSRRSSGQLLALLRPIDLLDNRAEPHSVKEMKNAQTKAFALMAIDALVERAATDANVRAELQREEARQKDPFFQRYIHQKLAGLPPL